MKLFPSDRVGEYLKYSRQQIYQKTGGKPAGGRKEKCGERPAQAAGFLPDGQQGGGAGPVHQKEQRCAENGALVPEGQAALSRIGRSDDGEIGRAHV